MDAFVCNKLLEWRLAQWIETFQDEEIDQQKLYCLEEHEIDHLISKTGPRARFRNHLKELKSQLKSDIVDLRSEEPSNVGVFSYTCGDDKDLHGTEDVILKNVKKIMTNVEAKLSDDTELGRFLRNEITNLKTETREVIGVFGQTGAGKSSLINAVVGEKDLLPTGSIAACTTVMLKVEDNSQRKQYQAEIEFITQMEWEDELWSAKNLITSAYEDNDEDDDEGKDLMEKLTAFYGENWEKKSVQNLMDRKYFREIPEFLQSVKKMMRCKTSKELMEKIARFTRSDLNEGHNRCFWPLVKCVTVRVPNNDLLKHVTLVDLPGKGDRNKSRDEMWKRVIDSCSTVWIVTNMNRAAADKDAWDILKSACSLVKNGGACENIHFICTKTDIAADERDESEVHQYILQRNLSAKFLVKQEIKKLGNLKKHLRDDCFEVFTVSSREFSQPKYLQQDETEIPKLREFIHCLNELHGESFIYVTGARHILSLMKETHNGNLVELQTNLCAEIKEILKENLFKVTASMKRAYTILDKCLTEGAENSRCLWQGSLQSIMHTESGSAFHTLKSVVGNNGIHKSKQGEVINLNSALSSFLTRSINEDFRNIFPNDGKSGHFYGVIHDFSLLTVSLRRKYKALDLQLRFLKKEEEKLKVRINKIIRNRKKMIYSSLTQSVEETMQDCYKKAATLSGKGSLHKMKHIIENHIHDVQDTIFDDAKKAMLNQLKQLMEDVVNTLSESLQKSIELSLRVDKSVPDISNEFEEVMKHYNELMSTEVDAELLL